MRKLTNIFVVLVLSPLLLMVPLLVIATLEQAPLLTPIWLLLLLPLAKRRHTKKKASA